MGCTNSSAKDNTNVITGKSFKDDDASALEIDVPEGLKVGDIIKSTGEGALVGMLNLVNGGKDVELHCQPRKPKNYVCRNTKDDGDYGTEDKDGGYPDLGDKWFITITVEEGQYKIEIGNQGEAAKFNEIYKFRETKIIKSHADVTRLWTGKHGQQPDEAKNVTLTLERAAGEGKKEEKSERGLLAGVLPGGDDEKKEPTAMNRAAWLWSNETVKEVLGEAELAGEIPDCNGAALCLCEAKYTDDGDQEKVQTFLGRTGFLFMQDQLMAEVAYTPKDEAKQRYINQWDANTVKETLAELEMPSDNESLTGKNLLEGHFEEDSEGEKALFNICFMFFQDQAANM